MKMTSLACCLALMAFAAGCDDDPASPSRRMVLDQQNLLEGALGGQGIGRFSDINGAPDPAGTSYDFQDAQTFIAGVSGELKRIKLPIRNLYGATEPVELQIRSVLAGVPDGDDGLVLGAVSVPADSMQGVDTADPATWVCFELGSLDLQVTAGQVYSYAVRTLDTNGYNYPPELTETYTGGGGFRRNRALTATWSPMADRDFGFQVWVATD